jgi:hypothetical protein
MLRTKSQTVIIKTTESFVFFAFTLHVLSQYTNAWAKKSWIFSPYIEQKACVVDPDPDPAFMSRGSRDLMTKNCRITVDNFLKVKIAIYLFLGLHD